MALLQKRQHSEQIQGIHFSLPPTNTLLIAGLGNPGKKYDGTRHNVGFAVLDRFVEATGADDWQDKPKFNCLQAEYRSNDTRVILIKPSTYMNNSGESIRAVMDFYKLSVDQVTIVHDELDLPIGQIKTRTGGGSAGHNGVQSVIDHLGKDVGRLRVGVNAPSRGQMEGADFVLAKFVEEEQSTVKLMVNESAIMLQEMIATGSLTVETRNVTA